MSITARYTETGAIVATIDGEELTIPDSMANRHRQMLAEWEAAGNTIAPYVAPPPTEEEVRSDTFKALPERVAMIDRLRNATPEQIDAYIDNNVTNLTQARTFLKTLTKVLATIVRD